MVSKYNNKTHTLDGYKFDSKAEMDFYTQFIQGTNIDWKFHPTFVLQDSFVDIHGTKHRAITYEADFEVKGVVIDIKGMATPVAKIKRKMFMKRYQNVILEWIVKNKKWGIDGWIEYGELCDIRRKNKKEKHLTND